MTFTVEITDTALNAIREQARYIAIDCQAPENAARWLERIWSAVDSLEHSPKRCHHAPENALRPYEIRQLNIGAYLILFTIDEDRRRVTIIGFRHGRHLPRPQDLPEVH